ncbi:MAG: hypothetical protein JXA57_21055 [Armatimonadetes bacterium]|nr:hypothetical protein [Armatimonadota bacterium]
MAHSDYPLRDVFSERDLERLRSGVSVESERPADDSVVLMLTEDYGGWNDYAVSLGEWFRQAARHGNDIRARYRSELRNNVSDHCAFLQPASELMAAYFLEVQQGFTLRYVPRQAGPTPDFQIHRNSLKLAVEVKTPDSVAPPLDGCRPFAASPSAAPLLRQAMKSARRQLDKSGNNLVLVIAHERPIFRDEAVDAAYGDLHLAIPLGEDGPIGDPYGVRDENVFFQPGKNTRIGAMGILWWTRRAESAGYVIHNAYAPNGIPHWAFDPWPQFVTDEAGRAMVWRNPLEIP